MSDTYVVIMAGGSGTRFWPASRGLRPKQLLALGKDEHEALLAATVRRVSSLVPRERVMVVTGEKLRNATMAAVPELLAENVLAEPAARNTAPCIGWATATIAARTKSDPTIVVLPADHFITDEAAFVGTLDTAIRAAREAKKIATIGIVPTRPETGYGYIEVGGEPGEVRTVKRFVEKPDRARAEEYLKSGQYLWNAGMFFFPASVMMRAIQEHLPQLAEGLTKIAQGDGATLKEVFPTLPSISIDNGVAEKEKEMLVVSGDFGWNDVGSWESAWELGAKDADLNVCPESAVVVDGKRNLVRDLTTSEKKRVYALVGVSDLVVVETDDAVLVIPRERAQDVRAVVDALKARGDTELL